MSNKQNVEREHDRQSKLSDYLYGVSKLLISGIGIGGLSPFITNTEMKTSNYICVVIGALAAIFFAYCANRVLKIKR